jgi:hypothetical protein
MGQPDLTPPKAVADAAKKGLDLHSEFNRGGTPVGWARARDLKNCRSFSKQTLKRMRSYFARHEVDKQAENFGNDDDPSAGYIAWLLWGGDEGRDWAETQLEKLEEKDDE